MSKLTTTIASCLVLILAAIAPQGLYAWTGKVVRIADGDTITVLHDRTEVKIRLHGIDTPEKRQAYGNAAKKATANLTAGKTVEVE